MNNLYIYPLKTPTIEEDDRRCFEQEPSSGKQA